MRQKSLKIHIVLHMASCAGRRHLAGICRYIAQGHNWDIHLHRRGYWDFPPEMLDDADGIITSTSINDETPRKAIARRIPISAIDMFKPVGKTARVSRALSDDRQVGKAMAEHILSFGNFRSFGFVFENECRWEDERRDGFIRALKAKHKSALVFRTQQTPDQTDGARNLSDWLRTLEKPAVVMASYDELAVKVIAAARQAKLNIPKDLAIVGTDDDEVLCNYTNPPLTSIRPGHEACGYAAAEELDRLIRGKPARTRHIPFETITDRKSLSPCIPASHILQAANDFIDKHACEGIGVDDVARALGVSRRLLSLRYAEYEGKSVHDALVGRRLREVMHLLEKTNVPIGEITEKCGFPSPNYLKRLFKQRTGKTMREWRSRGDV